MSASLPGTRSLAGASRWPAVRKVLARLVPLALYAALVVGVVLNAERVMDFLEATEQRLGPWGGLVFALGGGLFIGLAGPASLINLGAGALFGFWKGLAVAFGAALVGSLVAFGLARIGGAKLHERFAERHEWFRVLEEKIGTDAKLATFLRLSPVVPLAGSSYALGLARMKLGLFLKTAPAMVPPLAVYVGAAAVARGVWSTGSRPWWEWVVLGAGLLATVGVMIAVTRAIRAAVAEARGEGEAKESETDAGSPASKPAEVRGVQRTDDDSGDSRPPPETVRRPRSGEVELPVTRREGRPRRVGVEIELAGVPVPACAEAVAKHFGGEVQRQHDQEAQVETDLGTFTVELDSRPLKEIAAELEAHADEETTVEAVKNRFLLGLAEPFVPVEVVTPPLTIDRFADLDAFVTDLREQGAMGTGDRLFYAFGVHFNPEVASLGAESIAAHMQAFFLLRDWLRRAGRTDIARRVTPHIEPHPDALVERVLQTSYAPSITQLIDDYLELSPTRNRDLDLLPLFAHIDEERVRAVLPDEKINPRPTYHYRLPNSQVGDPTWRISDEWRSWVLVERLAHDRERLHQWIGEWHRHRGEVLVELFQPWADEVENRMVE
ncbi:MAG: hypothetical protein CMN30_18875 [Sandaracinus sp.]|nr:hypothetical protein [Sandaracinus sp.]